jgi:coenzyme F420-reducing hydrogenase delta subunit
MRPYVPAIVVLALATSAQANDPARTYRVQLPDRASPVQLTLGQAASGGWEVTVQDGERTLKGPATVETDSQGVMVLNVPRLTPSGSAPGERQRSGMSQALGGKPSPTGPSSTPSSSGFAPSSLRLRLAQDRDPPLAVKFSDASGREVQARGRRDWNSEVERLRARLDDPQATDRTKTEASLTKALQNREKAERDAIDSGDPARISEVARDLQDRLADVRTRRAKLPPSSDEAKLLGVEQQQTERDLDHALNQRERAEVKAVESGDVKQVSETASAAQNRLAELRTRRSKLPPSSEESQLLAEDQRRTERLLDHALNQRERLEVKAIESGDAEQIGETASAVQDRLAELRTRRSQLPPSSEESQLLAEDQRRTERVLDHALNQRERVEVKAIESGDAEQIGETASAVQDRLAELRTRRSKLPPSSEESQLLAEDQRRTERVLDHALNQRERAEVKAIESKDRAKIGQTTSAVQDRLAELRTRRSQLPPSSEESQLLAEDQRRTERVLDHARTERERSEIKAIESGDAKQIEAATRAMESRVARLGARRSQLSPTSPTSELYEEDQRQTERVLDAARKKQSAADNAALQSGDRDQINSAGRRISERLRHLKSLEKRIKAEKQTTPKWLSEQINANKRLIQEARAARAKVTPQ